MDITQFRSSSDGSLTETTATAINVAERFSPLSCDTFARPDHALLLPVLSSDGSVRRRPRYTTPPAALSSLAAKMTRSMSDSLSSLDEASYDMVDDISEISSDGHDTVSIASTNGVDEDAEEQNENIHIPEQLNPVVAEQQAFKVRMPFHDSLGVNTTQDSQQLTDSCSHDLDTPQQSIIDHSTASSQLTERGPSKDTAKTLNLSRLHLQRASSSSTLISSEPQSYKYRSIIPKEATGVAEAEASKKPFFQLMSFPVPTATLGWLLLGMLSVYLCTSLELYSGLLLTPSRDFNRPEAVLRELNRLSTHSLIPDLERYTSAINYTHLVPERVPIGTDLAGLPYYGTKDVRYQALGPNHIIVSLPEVRPGTYLEPYSTSAQRGVDMFNITQRTLVRGIYAITVPPSDAHGTIRLDMACVKPTAKITITHDFGHRYLHGSTYQKAGKELSKAITKDIAVARDVAKSIGTTLQPEINAKLHDVSLMLRSAATDLSIFVNKTATSIHKVEQDGKDLALRVEHEIVELGKDVHTVFDKALNTLKSLVPSIQAVTQSLQLSRQRAVTIAELFSKSKRLRSPAYKNRHRTNKLHNMLKVDAKALRREHKQKTKAERKFKVSP